MRHSMGTAALGSKGKTYRLSMTALMTAITCVLAPFSVPVGPVPISLTNLVIFVSLFLLGWKMGTVSCLVYLLIGLAGLPVFSGFSGGIGKLMGPTGGYIIGFFPMAVLAGLGIERFQSRFLQFLSMLLGTAVCYAFGTVWFCAVMGTDMAAALGACVLPFIPGDMIKMLLALKICPLIQKRLRV